MSTTRNVFRFSLASILTLVFFVAIFLTGLRSANWLWQRVVFTLTFGLLLGAVLAVVYRRGLSRAFWLGFALFGWSCFAATNLPAMRIVESQLVSIEVYTALRKAGAKNGKRVTAGKDSNRVYLYPNERLVSCGFTLLFACTGGVVGCKLYSPYDKDELERNEKALQACSPQS